MQVGVDIQKFPYIEVNIKDSKVKKEKLKKKEGPKILSAIYYRSMPLVDIYPSAGVNRFLIKYVNFHGKGSCGYTVWNAKVNLEDRAYEFPDETNNPIIKINGINSSLDFLL
jgi:hypothetical protein